MKRIKTAELKTHLSHYLRELQSSDEPIEVCVREQTVAYLTKVNSVPMSTADQHEHSQLQRRLVAVGLVLGAETLAAPGHLPEVNPLPAGDGRANVATVEEMRLGKDW